MTVCLFGCLMLVLSMACIEVCRRLIRRDRLARGIQK